MLVSIVVNYHVCQIKIDSLHLNTEHALEEGKLHYQSILLFLWFHAILLFLIPDMFQITFARKPHLQLFLQTELAVCEGCVPLGFYLARNCFRNPKALFTATSASVIT